MHLLHIFFVFIEIEMVPLHTDKRYYFTDETEPIQLR